VKLREEARQLEAKKAELEDHLSTLLKQIDEAKDDIVKDPLTKLYNQDMLKHMIKEQFVHPVASHKTRGLLLIQLDQLPEINKKYDKETGDETVRNMVYVLDQVKEKDVMLFKQSGPGVFAMIDGETKENIIKEAVKFRNSIEKSSSFIEQVSISIAVVTCEEVDVQLSIEEKMKNLLTTLEKRMSYAKIKGYGQIVDDSTTIPTQAEGFILLVDQDEINRNMLYRIFKRINYDVIIADSVVEAYQMIQKRKIDVVISEINLSKMDGFQLKMMMNDSKTYHEIPFIMVSHNKTIDNIRRGNLLDVDLILEKPIVPEELIGHVKRMKEKRKS
jgi:diguanylate cyclase (GGDEF)-like protein